MVVVELENLQRFMSKRIPGLLSMWCAVAVICCSCSSLATHFAEKADERPRVYPGAKVDAKYVNNPGEDAWLLPASLLFTYGLIDILPSTVFDTLLLPVDLLTKPEP